MIKYARVKTWRRKRQSREFFFVDVYLYSVSNYITDAYEKCIELDLHEPFITEQLKMGNREPLNLWCKLNGYKLDRIEHGK